MLYSLKDGAYFTEESLACREARRALLLHEKPFRLRLRQSQALVYTIREGGGVWHLQTRLERGHRVCMMGIADDAEPADGKRVLSFQQAMEIAETVFQENYTEYFSERRLDSIPRQLRISPIGDRYTVGHALRDYLFDKKLRSSKAGFNHAMAYCNAYVVGDLSSIPCDELRAEHLRPWLHRVGAHNKIASNFARQGHNSPIVHNDREGVRKAKRRANSVLITLKAALNMALRDERIESDAAWRRMAPYKNVKKARSRIFNKDEVDRLLAAAQPDLRRLILGGLYTGCRAGERRELRPSNFD